MTLLVCLGVLAVLLAFFAAGVLVGAHLIGDPE